MPTPPASSTSPYPHLRPELLSVMALPDKERIQRIKPIAWINYPRAKAILAKLEDLLEAPKSPRPDNLLLVGDSNSGKSAIAFHFLEKHPEIPAPDKDAKHIGVYHRLRESYGQQFCPHCLAEEIYLKKQWRLALVTCCTKHGTILLDRCPECQSPVHFYRDDICPATCFNCKFDLRAATTVAATPEMLAAQSKWLSGIEEGVAIGEASGPDYFDVLRHLTALMLSKYAFCRDIGHHTAAAIGIPWDQPRRSINSGMESLGITDRIKLLQMANWLLDEWPKRFINFCQGHKIWSAALTKELPNAPAWYKGIVDKHLKKGSRKGTHGPPSKQARNWKPIQTIPRSRKTNRQALATTQSVVSSKYAAQSNLS